jgi:hypothetical protein
MCYVNPVPCKNDPDNSKFGGSPVPSRFHATQPICLVRELAKYEIMRMRANPVGASQTRRKDLPLVLSPAGRSWSKAELSKFFDGLIRLVCSEERAKQLSVHSFRVWLACALLPSRSAPRGAHALADLARIQSHRPVPSSQPARSYLSSERSTSRTPRCDWHRLRLHLLSAASADAALTDAGAAAPDSGSDDEP